MAAAIFAAPFRAGGLPPAAHCAVDTRYCAALQMARVEYVGRGRAPELSWGHRRGLQWRRGDSNESMLITSVHKRPYGHHYDHKACVCLCDRFIKLNGRSHMKAE